MKTRTGQYPIGFRRGSSEWQQELTALTAWAQANELFVIDLGKDGAETAPLVQAAGLSVGSVDLPAWQEMISPDPGQRAAAVAQNGTYIRACTAVGVENFFLVMLPADPDRPRIENFGYLLESFAELVPVLVENKGRLVVEGWPGPGALCCTPADLRHLFQEIPTAVMGINYDPSHLLRLGIDYLRFLNEFGDRVYHVHGKDAEILRENQYLFGREQPATFTKPIPYGAYHWRYTIPGQGQIRWVEIFRQLTRFGYQGAVTIELEDANFRGSAGAEQLGILQGARFLAGC